LEGRLSEPVKDQSSSQAYKPPSMRVGASQASTIGKKVDFGKGSLNKGSFRKSINFVNLNLFLIYHFL
jgi:hypothetical protein